MTSLRPESCAVQDRKMSTDRRQLRRIRCCSSWKSIGRIKGVNLSFAPILQGQASSGLAFFVCR